MKGYILVTEFPNKYGEYSDLCVNQSIFTNDIYTSREEAEKWLDIYQEAAQHYPVLGGVAKLSIVEVRIH